MLFNTAPAEEYPYNAVVKALKLSSPFDLAAFNFLVLVTDADYLNEGVRWDILQLTETQCHNLIIALQGMSIDEGHAYLVSSEGKATIKKIASTKVNQEQQEQN